MTSAVCATLFAVRSRTVLRYRRALTRRARGDIGMSSPAERVRVSVFVQAYNTAQYVGECLESVLRQETPCVRDVFVIDDASTDGTSDEVARFEAAGVRLVRHARNRGATATANEGYAAATGEFVVRLDSDDRLRPGFFAAIVPALVEHPTAGL